MPVLLLVLVLAGCVTGRVAPGGGGGIPTADEPVTQVALDVGQP